MTRRVFIVEDEPLVVEALSRLLERRGYRVSGTAASGEDALARIPPSDAEVVLMDLDLDGDMDGYATALQLRTHMDVPILFLSGTATEELLAAMQSTPWAGYLSKPIDANALVVNIEMAASRHEAALGVQENAESRAQSDFCRNVSHELRTPLNAIIGLSEALLEPSYGELSARQAANLHTIRKSGLRLLEVVNDAIDIARVEAGELSVELASVGLAPLLRECVELLESAVGAKNQLVLLDLPDSPLIARGDARRIRQAMLAVLTEVATLTPDDGGLLLIARKSEDAVTILVTGTRDGAASERPQSFDASGTNGDLPMNGGAGGAHLRLALARRLVELHGGSLRPTRESRARGAGASFEITLFTEHSPVPRHESSRPSSETKMKRVDVGLSASGDRRVGLIARDGGRFLDHALESAGFGVCRVESPSELLDECRREDTLAVVVDVRSEQDLAALATARAGLGVLPIVAVTAGQSTIDRTACVHAGATHHLAGPLDISRLQSLLLIEASATES